MASISPLLFLSLCFTVGTLTIFQPLITFTDQSPNNHLISIVVPIFLFLLPFTFISAIILLILHVTIPQSVYTKHLAMVTWALTFITLFLGVAVMSSALTKALILDTVKATVVGIVLLIACVCFAKSFHLPRYRHNGSFIPAFTMLCISAGTHLLSDQILFFSNHNQTNYLSNILFHLLLFCNFNLAMALLLLHASAMSDGSQRLISVIMMKRLVTTTVAMSFTIALIGVYMMVVSLAGIGSSYF